MAQSMQSTVGIIGGGQLGRMLTEAANRLGIQIVSLDAQNAPAKQINATSQHVVGSFKDKKAIEILASRCDVMTVETEHVDTRVLREISENQALTGVDRASTKHKVDIQPHWRTIETIQDKFEQKMHLVRHNIATPKSIALTSRTLESMTSIAKELGYPFMLKARRGAYDGRGNCPIRDASQLSVCSSFSPEAALYVEQWAPFKAELAVMVIKTDSTTGGDPKLTTKAFPVVETVHEDSICKVVYAPPRNIPKAQIQKAQDLARETVATLWGKGIYGVEMFLLHDGSMMINEIAPRPHNSGHYTIEACPISQFDAHLRAILDLPIPEESIKMRTPTCLAIMINILGGHRTDSHTHCARHALGIPGATVHMYGKAESRMGRKMGHVTITGDDQNKLELFTNDLMNSFNLIRNEPNTLSQGPQPNQDDLLSSHSSFSGRPLIAITMGSDSDRDVLRPGVQLLQDCQIPFIVTITSAHRTPDRMMSFAKNAAAQGVKVIIAAAGGAAHLPGMIAANTWLPVIGVPVRASVLDGLDSLLSIVQMPRGCPVATVAINNSVNAAQLAMRILATSHHEVRQKTQKLLDDQTLSVEQKADRMDLKGFEGYDK